MYKIPREHPCVNQQPATPERRIIGCVTLRKGIQRQTSCTSGSVPVSLFSSGHASRKQSGSTYRPRLVFSGRLIKFQQSDNSVVAFHERCSCSRRVTFEVRCACIWGGRQNTLFLFGVSGTSLQVSGTNFFCNASRIFIVRQFSRSASVFRSAPAHYTKNVFTF